MTKNWAGNYEYQAAEVIQPESLDALQALVKNSEQLKVLGTQHSFNHIADTTATHVTLGKLPRVFKVDSANRQVTVSGDMAYGEFCGALHEAGFALHNLASLPHVSVAGAIATATHGSGVSNGNLATEVVGITFVSATGDLVSLKQGDADFDGVVVQLGALGAIITITLAIEPTYQMRQWTYQNLAFTDLANNFADIMASGYSVSVFSDWDPARGSRILLKQRVDEALPPNELFGAQRVDEGNEQLAAARTLMCGVVGPWHDRLPHFRMGHTPSVGEELQTEYFVASHLAADAIRAVQQLFTHITPLLFATELRAVAGDNLWMSPCYQQDSVAIHFTWKPDWSGVRAVLPLIEAALAPFEARPHWGKLFGISAETVRSIHPQLTAFQQLIHKYDPSHKFRNAFLDSYIYPTC